MEKLKRKYSFVCHDYLGELSNKKKCSVSTFTSTSESRDFYTSDYQTIKSPLNTDDYDYTWDSATTSACVGVDENHESHLNTDDYAYNWESETSECVVFDENHVSDGIEKDSYNPLNLSYKQLYQYYIARETMLKIPTPTKAEVLPARTQRKYNKHNDRRDVQSKRDKNIATLRKTRQAIERLKQEYKVFRKRLSRTSLDKFAKDKLGSNVTICKEMKIIKDELEQLKCHYVDQKTNRLQKLLVQNNSTLTPGKPKPKTECRWDGTSISKPKKLGKNELVITENRTLQQLTNILKFRELNNLFYSSYSEKVFFSRKLGTLNNMKAKKEKIVSEGFNQTNEVYDEKKEYTGMSTHMLAVVLKSDYYLKRIFESEFTHTKNGLKYASCRIYPTTDPNYLTHLEHNINGHPNEQHIDPVNGGVCTCTPSMYIPDQYMGSVVKFIDNVKGYQGEWDDESDGFSVRLNDSHFSWYNKAYQLSVVPQVRIYPPEYYKKWSNSTSIDKTTDVSKFGKTRTLYKRHTIRKANSKNKGVIYNNMIRRYGLDEARIKIKQRENALRALHPSYSENSLAQELIDSADYNKLIHEDKVNFVKPSASQTSGSTQAEKREFYSNILSPKLPLYFDETKRIKPISYNSKIVTSIQFNYTDQCTSVDSIYPSSLNAGLRQVSTIFDEGDATEIIDGVINDLLDSIFRISNNDQGKESVLPTTYFYTLACNCYQHINKHFSLNNLYSIFDTNGISNHLKYKFDFISQMPRFRGNSTSFSKKSIFENFCKILTPENSPHLIDENYHQDEIFLRYKNKKTVLKKLIDDSQNMCTKKQNKRHYPVKSMNKLRQYVMADKHISSLNHLLSCIFQLLDKCLVDEILQHTKNEAILVYLFELVSTFIAKRRTCVDLYLNEIVTLYKLGLRKTSRITNDLTTMPLNATLPPQCVNFPNTMSLNNKTQRLKNAQMCFFYNFFYKDFVNEFINNLCNNPEIIFAFSSQIRQMQHEYVNQVYEENTLLARSFQSHILSLIVDKLKSKAIQSYDVDAMLNSVSNTGFDTNSFFLIDINLHSTDASIACFKALVTLLHDEIFVLLDLLKLGAICPLAKIKSADPRTQCKLAHMRIALACIMGLNLQVIAVVRCTNVIANAKILSAFSDFKNFKLIFTNIDLVEQRTLNDGISSTRVCLLRRIDPVRQSKVPQFNVLEPLEFSISKNMQLQTQELPLALDSKYIAAMENTLGFCSSIVTQLVDAATNHVENFCQSLIDKLISTIGENKNSKTQKTKHITSSHILPIIKLPKLYYNHHMYLMCIIHQIFSHPSFTMALYANDQTHIMQRNTSDLPHLNGCSDKSHCLNIHAHAAVFKFEKFYHWVVESAIMGVYSLYNKWMGHLVASENYDAICSARTHLINDCREGKLNKSMFENVLKKIAILDHFDQIQKNNIWFNQFKKFDECVLANLESHSRFKEFLNRFYAFEILELLDTLYICIKPIVLERYIQLNEVDRPFMFNSDIKLFKSQ